MRRQETCAGGLVDPRNCLVEGRKEADSIKIYLRAPKSGEVGNQSGIPSPFIAFCNYSVQNANFSIFYLREPLAPAMLCKAWPYIKNCLTPYILYPHTRTYV